MTYLFCPSAKSSRLGRSNTVLSQLLPMYFTLHLKVSILYILRFNYSSTQSVETTKL